jgi:hypothetical protein
MSLSFRYAVLLALLASSCRTQTPVNQPQAAGVRGLVPYEMQDPGLILYKPADWTVTPQHTATDLHIVVSEPGGASRVEADFADNRTAKFNSLTLLASFTRQMKQNHPDLNLSEIMACKDPAISCAVTTIAYTANGVPMKGRYFFHADTVQAVVRGYQAPAAQFDGKRPLLLDVLTNIHLVSAGAQAAATKPPLNVQFTQRSAPDGSWRLSLPSDWSATGAQGKVLAGAPDGGSGFLFTSFTIFPPRYMGGIALPPAAIVSPYVSPPQAIGVIWQKFNNRQIHILASKADSQTAGYCTVQLRKRCEAADVQLTWVSPKGAACTGSFKVLNGVPSITGEWFSIVAGIWGPSNDMDQYLPVLDSVARSFSINDQYAQEYIQEGMQHLRALQAQTQQAINGLYAAIDDSRRDAEARSDSRERSVDAFSDYMLGNSYWISDIEGGKVYATDPWGTTDTETRNRLEGAPYDYINFEGQNPNYPSEQMREITSYDVQHMQQ